MAYDKIEIGKALREFQTQSEDMKERGFSRKAVLFALGTLTGRLISEADNEQQLRLLGLVASCIHSTLLIEEGVIEQEDLQDAA